ncbi:unnamed protein product, partial [marine sediment metagenome]
AIMVTVAVVMWSMSVEEAKEASETASVRYYPHGDTGDQGNTNDIHEVKSPFAFTGINWFTFPSSWCQTNGYKDADSRLVANGQRMRDGYQIRSSVQLGFRDDGVVVWRRGTKEDV